jgi:hypothetical protein
MLTGANWGQVYINFIYKMGTSLHKFIYKNWIQVYINFMYKNGDKLTYGKFMYKKWGQVYINFMYKYGDKFTYILYIKLYIYKIWGQLT